MQERSCFSQVSVSADQNRPPANVSSTCSAKTIRWTVSQQAIVGHTTRYHRP
jgi:hypothetical protein